MNSKHKNAQIARSAPTANTRRLTIAMTPNARAQPLPKAGAERTLEAVGCSALFGSDGTALHGLQQFFDSHTRHCDGVSCLQAAGDTGRVFLVVRIP
jgi:hypothetical protein